MTTFADASAVVKIYIDEEHSALVRSVASTPDRLTVSELTRVEVVSALWRMERMGDLPLVAVVAISDTFEIDWLGSQVEEPNFAVVDLNHWLLAAAAALVARHGLRTGDAIQLASAVAGRDADPDRTTFLGFDSRLRDAAAREGFALLPGEL